MVRQENGQALLLLILVVFVFGLIASGIFTNQGALLTYKGKEYKKPKLDYTTGAVVESAESVKIPQHKLQLGTLTFISVLPTPTPTPAPVVVSESSPTPTATPTPTPGFCQPEGPVINNCICPGTQKIGYWCPDGNLYSETNPLFAQKSQDPTCTKSCWAKPVIYLYPKQKTTVSVVLSIPGTVIDSIPHYPDGGWHNIVAYPNGELQYQETTYKELYYESSVPAIAPPKQGIIIKTENLKKDLTTYLRMYGLEKSERDEFLDYWLPKLETLQSPYILFSVVDKAEKERTDHVEISPKPDTMIAVLAYFKPLQKPIALTPLLIPQTPQRVGFTAIEWGGTIDRN